MRSKETPIDSPSPGLKNPQVDRTDEVDIESDLTSANTSKVSETVNNERGSPGPKQRPRRRRDPVKITSPSDLKSAPNTASTAVELISPEPKSQLRVKAEKDNASLGTPTDATPQVGQTEGSFVRSSNDTPEKSEDVKNPAPTNSPWLSLCLHETKAISSPDKTSKATSEEQALVSPDRPIVEKVARVKKDCDGVKKTKNTKIVTDPGDDWAELDPNSPLIPTPKKKGRPRQTRPMEGGPKRQLKLSFLKAPTKKTKL